MSLYTDDDVAAAATAYWGQVGYGWEAGDEDDHAFILTEFRTVLDAVAPAIAARSLREAAGIISGTSTSPRYEPGWIAAAKGLEARADKIEEEGRNG